MLTWERIKARLNEVMYVFGITVQVPWACERPCCTDENYSYALVDVGGTDVQSPSDPVEWQEEKE